MSTERDHLDAETVAAWLDGGLDAVSLAAAEAHASHCDRCQALLATTVKTLPDAAPSAIPRLEAGAASAWWRWWMAPIAATAAAVTLWMVVPQRQLQRVATAPPAEVASRATSRAPATTPPPPAPASDPAPTPPARRAADNRERSVEAIREAAPADARESQFAPQKVGAAAANAADAAREKEREDAKGEARGARLEAEPARSQPAPAAPPAAAAPAEVGALRDAALAPQLRRQAAILEFVSPDPQHRWRATADGIERSEDGGRTWLPVRLAQGEVVTAGASPAPRVCWIVGRAGLVLLATDGTNFTRLPFPEAVDLRAVASPEIRVAVVTTADGRTFRTENAGRTWNQQ